MKRILSIAVLLSVLAVSGFAFATPITLSEVGVSPSATINATFGGAINGTYNVLAGYYQLSINGASPVSGFCVDPAWAPTNTAQAYDLRVIDANTALKYQQAAYLFSQSNAGNAAAVQIAIWKTVMGADFTWNHQNLALQTTVKGLLDNLPSTIPTSFDLSLYSLAVSPGDGTPTYGKGYQDYIVQTPVPEPSTIILLSAGLLGLGIMAKRRKNKL